MTEQEWLECSYPDPLEEFIAQRTTKRKRRLYTVACCRIARAIFQVKECEEQLAACWWAVLLAEKVADDKSVEDKALQAAKKITEWLRANNGPFLSLALCDAGCAALDCLNGRMFDPSWKGYADKQKTAQEVRLLRCMFGNPFRPITCHLAWLTSNVVSLAQGIYEGRRLTDLPVLADALEDAGCNQQDLLQHLRSPGEHVRGCWAVDLVLGKE